MKHKSYNPFKMWGSYVGAWFLPAIFVSIMSQNISSFFIWWVAVSFFGATFLLWYIPLGFLLGWGIHSLFRRYSK